MEVSIEILQRREPINFLFAGNISIESLEYSYMSEISSDGLRFTLTSVSTGGPATTVTWTRDSVILTEGTVSVLDDPVTAQYTHNLTVAGRPEGTYTITVANNKPSTAVHTLTVLGKLLYMSKC